MHLARSLFITLALLASPTLRAEPGAAAPASAAWGDPQLRGLELSRSPAVAFQPWLEGSDPAALLQAARALGRLHDPAAVPLLEPLLEAEEPALRAEAAFALGRYPETGPALLAALQKEERIEVRTALLDSLGRSGGAELLPPLMEALRAGEGAEAVAASHAIGRLGVRGELSPLPHDAAELLLEQLSSLDLDRRRSAAFALARTQPSGLPSPLEDRLLAGVERQADAVARAWLVRAASTALDETRWAQAVSLAQRDASQGVRIALARGLATRGGSSAASSLTPLLADADRPVRIAALSAASRLPWQDGWQEPLEAMLALRDPAQQARTLPILASAGRLAEPEGWLNPTVDSAIRAGMLVTLDSPEALATLAVEDRSVEVRTAATERLLGLEPPPDRALLLDLVAQPDPVVAGLAATHLAAQPDEALLEAIQAQLVERNDYAGILAMLEALKVTLEGLGAEPRGPRPPALPGSLRTQVNIRVAELQKHEDLGVRRAARALAPLLGLPEAGPPPFPRLLDADALSALLGARVVTERGELVIRFHRDAAPYTVQRWVELAEAGHFDGQRLHRVVPDFVVQGGCPRGDGYGGPDFTMPDEFSPLPYRAGAVGMATAGPDTAGSQWFVTLSPQPHLDGDYTLFGELVQGQDVLRRLRQRDVIERVIIERSRAPSSPP